MRNLYSKVRHLPNVIGVGRGYKVKNGKRTSEIAAIVNVSKKVPIESLAPHELVPATLNGLTTDVIETGVIRAFELTSKVRPLQLGYSIGHPAITAGTIGGVVTYNGKPAILSNNHVMANSNAAAIGDPILQPGPYDQTAAGEYQVATLANFKEIGFVSDIPSECNIGQAATWLANAILAAAGRRTRLVAVQALDILNKVDAAVAVIDAGIEFDDACRIEVMSKAGIGDAVYKVGRTTERTEGSIDQIDVTLQVQYGAGQIAVFTDQFISSTLYSQPGDSGSGIRSLGGLYHLKGLLFAGSDTVTVGCQADNVAAELGIFPIF